MRKWLTFLLLAGCADEPLEGNPRCEQGDAIVNAAVDELIEASPACVRDDECVRVSVGVRCKGFEQGSCGVIVHRDVKDDWDATSVCAEIEKLPAPSNITCSTQPSCAISEPVCLAGRCSSAR